MRTAEHEVHAARRDVEWNDADGLVGVERPADDRIEVEQRAGLERRVRDADELRALVDRSHESINVNLYAVR